MQEVIRAINGTLQTRIPRLSTDEIDVRKGRNVMQEMKECIFRRDQIMFWIITNDFLN
jgi:hypothetical protein